MLCGEFFPTQKMGIRPFESDELWSNFERAGRWQIEMDAKLGELSEEMTKIDASVQHITELKKGEKHEIKHKSQLQNPNFGPNPPFCRHSRSRRKLPYAQSDTRGLEIPHLLRALRH